MQTQRLAITLTAFTASLATAAISAAPLTAGMQVGITPDNGSNTTKTDIVGNDWNDLNTNATHNTIHNLDGVTLDGVSVQMAGGGINNAGEDNWAGLSSQGGSAPPEFVDSVTTDLLFGNSTVTITGLDTALTYNLYSTSHGGGSGFDGRDEAHTVTGDVSYGTSELNRGASRLGAFHTFLGVKPDNSGTIVLQMTATDGSNNPAFNGLLINVVPEPGSLALLAMGGFIALRRRR